MDSLEIGLSFQFAQGCFEGAKDDMLDRGIVTLAIIPFRKYIKGEWPIAPSLLLTVEGSSATH